LRIYPCLAFLLFLVALPVLALGYPDPEKLAREIERLEEYLHKAQAAEGPECAPESLAVAQSHLARAKEEFLEGDFWAAEDAIRLCGKEARGIWGKILTCGRDLDRDGIPDRKDQCLKDPETYNDYMDEDGCPDQIPRLAVLTGDKIEILVPILFDDNTQRPLAESYAVLEEVARIMKENPDLRFRIRTHLDDGLPAGQADYTTGQRADSIRDALTYLGIPVDRLETEARGSREPVAANDSSWGRMLNQRVEFILIP
jgi:outer membrane protein OmpA-like peptidoglycan-associated protein